MELLQVAQRATDLTRAIAFYEKLLGRRIDAFFPESGLAFFMLGGTRLMLTEGAPSAILYFRVDNVVKKTAELKAEGVTFSVEPNVIFSHADNSIGLAGTDEWMAFLTDSEGNTIAIASQQLQ
ncbi:MAG: VOC family protein [Salinibacterium sp.]|nr:MAG: VOC family protein [Salinibacterium sp.]